MESTPKCNDGNPPDGAKDFLLDEYHSLYVLHDQAKAAGETRLNFYVTFTGAVGTAAIAVQSFIVPEIRAWLLAGTALIILLVGLVTFRKMLQRRVATVVYRRRLSRIRAWFVHHYPIIAPGLPYGINQNVRMDWGKNKLGSSAFSVAVINTALIFASVASIPIVAFGTSAVVWALPTAVASGVISWYLHHWWKNRWMKSAEEQDQKDLQTLDEINQQSEGVAQPNLKHG